MIIRIFTLLIVFSFFTSVCFSEDQANVLGKALYDQRCLSCHGEKGLGDGASMKSMPLGIRPKPFTVQPKVAVDYASFKSLIEQGGPAFELSALMAPNPGITDEAVTALYNYVNTLKSLQE